MRQLVSKVAVLGAVAVVGCSLTLGVSDYKVGTTAPDAAGACQDFGMADSPCRTCELAQCCDESRACREDADCKAFAECLARCSHDDGDCLAICYQRPKTFAIRQWLGCTITHCADTCMGCAEPGSAFGAACGNCQTNLACAEHKACREDPDCRGWMACVTERCNLWQLDAACRVTCTQDFPVGAPFRAWGTKIAACANQCDWGLAWQCATPTPPSMNPTMPSMPVGDSSQSTTLSLSVISLLGTTANPTLTVKACRDLDGVCGAPVTTDASGVATVTLNVNGTKLESLYTATYFDLSVPSGDRQLVYLGRSLTAAQTVGKVQWLDRTTPEVQSSGVFTPGKGVIVMVIADCVGAANIFTTSGNPTATLEGGAPAVYSRGGLPDPTVQSAFQAWFYPVDPGKRTVHVIDPAGRDVYQATVEVDAGALTLLYVNYPIWLL